ncbi:MAG: PAS domain S-box protein [FCB group bacterium]|nr:PAS domain S-box protein [FCB group bacterium]
MSEFPVVYPINYLDLTFGSIFLISVVVGYFIIIRLNVTALEVGWSIFGYAVFITYLNRITDSPPQIGMIFSGIFNSFGLIVIVLGLYHSLKLIKEQLARFTITEFNRRESEMKYRSIFEQSKDAIYITTREGKFVEANQSTLDLFKIKPDEFKGFPVASLYVNPEDRNRFRKIIERDSFIHDYKLALQKTDGTPITCLETAVVRKDENDNIIGYQGIIRDITGEEKVRDDLREREERIRSMILSMNELIFTMDLDGTIQTFYPPSDSKLEYDPDRYIGNKYDVVFPGDLSEKIVNAIDHLEWSNESQEFEYSEDVNGEEYWFLINITGQYDLNNRLSGYTIVQRDITQRQIAEAELRASNEALAKANARTLSMMKELEKTHVDLQLALEAAKEADALKSEFLASTSHELRTPLNSIIGFLQLVLDGYCDTPEEEKEYLKNALMSSNHLLRLINDVLDIAKIEAGKMELTMEDVNIKALMDDLYILTHVQAEQKKLSLSMQGIDEDLWIRADSQKLKQIFLNLIGNSIKFTKEGGIKISVEEDTAAGRVHVMVEDTGIGIAPEKQKKVFDKFAQADGSTSREFGGTGLGLSITKSLVELMNGTISLTSEGEGKGTTLKLSFKLAVKPTGEKVNPGKSIDAGVNTAGVLIS